ncbi:Translation factor GUF1-like, mitochondrial [Quillaja saponaria]|uniref:Translation factor GUF1-like, mitochondrial n=1 Tax=Quillaja saponaria TaxID=32244 RepID=A0AAD7VFY0_QUISA|nr:Translation factor GUF1-like, mitochondrial [Quillaja saponaria]
MGYLTRASKSLRTPNCLSLLAIAQLFCSWKQFMTKRLIYQPFNICKNRFGSAPCSSCSHRVIERVPPPPGLRSYPLPMLSLDSYYIEYKEFFHVAGVSGTRNKISSAANGQFYDVLDVSIINHALHTELTPTGVLLSGQVGYVVSGMHSTKDKRGRHWRDTLPKSQHSRLFQGQDKKHKDTQNWLNLGGDLYNRRYANKETKISPATVSSLSLNLEFYAGGDITATPAIFDGTLYFPSWNGYIYAVKASNGSLIWRQNLQKLTGFNNTGFILNANSTVSRSTPAIAGNLLIVGINGPGAVIALKRSTGKLVWSTKLDNHNRNLITMSGTYYKGITDAGS